MLSQIVRVPVLARARIWLAVLTSLCCLAPHLHAQSEPAGVIRGAVSNEVTREFLGGAIVRIAELNRDIQTEKDGSYEFADVPAGTYTVSVEYTGLESKSARVTVGAQAGARQDFALTSSIYVLPEFTVASEREGNAAAIMQQKNAPNIVNSITADAFGDPAKGNIGNFLRRIPGVSGTSDEVDTQNIQIRGMASSFTQLDMDGSRYAAGGTGRGQDASGIPTDMIERVEVIKAPTPDTEADSLGGRVNLVTKSAFDRKGREIRLRAAGSYSFTYGTDVGKGRSSWLSPEFVVTYSDVFSVFGGSNNLGIIVQGNFNRVLDVRGTTAWDSPSSGSGPRQFNNVSVALHGNDRYGGSVRADYKFSRRFSVGTSLQYNAYVNTMLRQRNQLLSGTIRPAISDNYFSVVDGAQYGIERGDRDQQRNRVAARLYTKYNDRSNGFKFDTDFSAQRTTENSRVDQINWRSNQRIDYVLDRRHGFADRRWPYIRPFRSFYTGSASNTTARPTIFLENLNPFSDDFSNMTGSNNTGQWQRLFSKNEIVTAKANVSKRFDWRWPVEFKTGVGLRNESMKQSRDDLRGSFSSAFGTNFSSLRDPDWDLGGAIGRYPVGNLPSLYRVTDALGVTYRGPADDPIDRWNFNSNFALNTNSTRQNTLQNNRRIWERIYSTYFQSNVDLGRLNLLGGIRYEYTDVTRNQPTRDRRTGIVNTLAEWTTRRYSDGTYDQYYPSIHGRYNISQNLIARASWGQTSGRPNWGNLLGLTDRNDATRTINVPNLELEPRTSKNIDVSLEYYFEPVGVVSVGVFKKKITNFDVSFSRPIPLSEAVAEYGAPDDGSGMDYTLTSRINSGWGEVEGVELNYSQQLSNILPGALRGVGVFASFTYLRTEGNFTLSGTATPVKHLEDFIPRTANAGISYNWRRVELRGVWNFQDHFPEDTSNDPFDVKYRGSRWTLDFQGRYKVTRTVSVFANFTNVTSNHALKYRGYIDEQYRVETNALGFLATAGVEARF